MSTYTTVVLAAGRGTRMRSHLPKVLHPIAGRPLIGHVLAAIAAMPRDVDVSSDPPVLVLGYGADQIRSLLGEGYRYVYQGELLGTGHAVRQALDALRQQGALPRAVLVLCGDTPLVTAQTLTALLRVHQERRAALTLVTAIAPDPTGYGRIVRDSCGQVVGIREDRLCDDRERAITEINAGLYCFDAVWLADHLSQLQPWAGGEYYLTDVVELAAREQRPIATIAASWEEALGVNDRHQLAEAAAILRRRILSEHLLGGVTIVDPATTYIDVDVVIGRDTIIAPCTTISSGTHIGAECIIGPGSTIIAARIGDRCVVSHACLDHVELEANYAVAPYSVLRAPSGDGQTGTADGLVSWPASGKTQRGVQPLLVHPLWAWPQRGEEQAPLQGSGAGKE